MHRKENVTADPVDAIRKKVGPGARIAFVSGTFDVVHPGHVRLLKFARSVGDFLVVGVVPDGAVPAAIRVETIAALSMVDWAVPLTETTEAFIRRLRPHCVIKGAEYENRFNKERIAVESSSGRLLFAPDPVRFALPDRLTVAMPTDFPERHGFAVGDLSVVVDKFSALRVLVIGDTILDEYIDCDLVGMAQEDPTLVVTPTDTKLFLGGAGIVAAHAKGLGAQVDFVTVLGGDERAGFVRDTLSAQGIGAHAWTDPSRPTNLKQRFRAHGKTLLRVNRLLSHAIGPDIVAGIFATIEHLLDSTDLLLFADFNCGCLPQPLVAAIVAAASRRGVAMAADSQASSQTSDISRYCGMRLIAPTEPEARLALRDTAADLSALATGLQHAANAENVAITLGVDGVLLQSQSGCTDRLPAFNVAAKDVAGAGDSFFATASMALTAGADIWEAGYLGSIAAACQVGRIGNIPLTSADTDNP